MPHVEGGTLDGTDRLSLDRRLELLAEERRRHVVARLDTTTTPVAVADLARRIAERESGDSSTAAPDHQESVRRSLYHCHVPKLAAANVVDHDRERNTVEPASNFEAVSCLRESFAAVDDPGSE